LVITGSSAFADDDSYGFIAGKYASSQPRIMVQTRVDFSANRK
jgi:hypothetical protein